MAVFGSNDQSVNVRITSTSDSKGIDTASNSIDKLGKSSKDASGGIGSLRDQFLPLAGIAAGAGFAFDKMTTFMSGTIKSANNAESSMIGLNTVAKAFGSNAEDAQKAARDLAKDGLLTVSDASSGLKNLLASGFELPQAIKLMDRFKDSAAFNRQGTLAFGDAIVGATQGIKNGNSILVDNAGVTKNLSVILEEAGYSSQDLMKATTDTNVRMALFNGILKETNPFIGDASKLTETAAGKQAMYAAETELLKASIGESLQPALVALLQAITPIVNAFTGFATEHPKVVAAFVIISTAVLGLIGIIGGLGLAIIGLTPLFTAMGISGVTNVGLLSKAFGGLQSLIASPIIMPAIVIAAALLALNVLIDKWKATVNEVNGQTASHGSGTTSFYESLKKGVAAGKFSQTEANRRMKEYNANFQTFSDTPFLAKGGQAMSGQAHVVGEQGPELFVPNRSGMVIPNKESAKLMGGTSSGGSSITNVFNVYPQTASAVDRLFEKIDRDNELESKGLTPMRAV